MTRRNNPNLVPKWEPPKEKDFTEDLDEKHKESLMKYEDRRRSRITADASMDMSDQIEFSTTDESISSVPAKELPRENIVVESVVHSRDAISVWESRLSEKHHKEELEKQRLSVGKHSRSWQKAPPQVQSEQESTPDAISGNGSLPSSKHIERESVDISQVRNRWKTMDKSNKFKQPDPVVKKEKTTRKSTFLVNTPPAFRSSQTPSQPIHQQNNANIVNAKTTGPAVVTSSHVNESPIDREIREAAEREERWKQEQWDKMSEVSAVSSEEVFSERSSKETNEISSHQRTDIRKHSDISTSSDSQQHANDHKELDVESISSFGSSAGHVPSSPRASLVENSGKADTEAHTSNQEYSDSGIEEGSAPSVDVRLTPSDMSKRTDTDASIFSLDLTESGDSKEEEAVFRRKRISSLTNAVAPRGWEPTKIRGIGPVSPVSPVQRSLSRSEIKSAVSPTTPLHPVKENLSDDDKVTETVSNDNKEMPSTLESSFQQKLEQSPAAPEKVIEKPAEISTTVTSDAAPNVTETRKGGPIFVRKSGGPVGVSSSKSQLQTIMAREMEVAAQREAEWRQKQLELVNKGVDLSGHSKVHSTREIRTPLGHSAPPPVNSSQQTSEVKLRRPVGSLFDDHDDQAEVNIETDVSDEFKKREVVKAMRVPKRKSRLAMRWEEGQFQNTAPDDEE